MNVIKIHKITTFIAVVGGFVGAALFFFSQVDNMMRLNLLPESLEVFFGLIGIFFGTITVPAIILSVVLSLYRMSEHK